jgi:hypothetical protein
MKRTKKAAKKTSPKKPTRKPVKAKPKAKAKPRAAAKRTTKPAAPAKRPVRLPETPWPALGALFTLGPVGADQFGGVPVGFTAATWPICSGCDLPMLATLTVGAHPERLPLRAHAAVTVFVCRSCESWEAESGANAAVLVSPERLGQTLESPPHGVDGPTPVLDRRALSYQPETPRAENDYRIRDKVGGHPDWVQADETPTCKTCQARMRLVAQFSDSLDSRLNFGMGVGYVFVCPDEHDARFLWQR